MIKIERKDTEKARKAKESLRAEKKRKGTYVKLGIKANHFDQKSQY